MTDEAEARAADERSAANLSNQVAAEQQHLDVLYQRLDEIRAHVDYRLARAMADPIAGTPGSHTEQDAMVAGYMARMQELSGVDERLCFGRLDLVDGISRYVGRIGISDERHDSLLMDWRADAAAPFYQATAAAPDGVVRRRHIATKNREITGLDDDVLMIDAMSDQQLESVTGNDSLLTALDSARTGHMRDIVATIQAEQDAIIRQDANGILVVEGGPGTGKTVVALHRVAYLLYTHRERIARSGALVIGPNRAFLHYIDRVLPALGETGVVLKTVDELYPGVNATEHDPIEVAVLKGDARMAQVIAQAVADRQRPPDHDVPFSVNGMTITMTRSDALSSIKRARETGQTHNRARATFAKDLLRRLARKYAQALRIDIDDETMSGLVADLRDDIDIRRQINLCWLPMTATQLVSRMFADPRRLRSAAETALGPRWQLLARDQDQAWTTSDIPLLDEAAELLGEWDYGDHGAAREQATQARQLSYARDALEASGVAATMITAEEYAARFMQQTSLAPVAERAEADRSWAYGHVVVDEAQELTAMQWRTVMRRCPRRSMTIVGDPAQASSPGAIANWGSALEPYVEQRWRRKQLVVNYRTPRLIMDAAAQLLVEAGIDAPTPQAVRDGSWPIELVETDDVVTAAAAQAHIETDILQAGEIGVTVAQSQLAATRSALQPTISRSHEHDLLKVAVITPAGAKGLEFDSVIILERAAVYEESPVSDLYVSMTRPTQRLTFIHSVAIPAPLARAIAAVPNS